MMHDSPANPSIHAEIAPKLNFACHQSAFSFLRRLQVENGAAESFLENVQDHLLADPGFLKPKTWHLDRIPPQGSVTVADRDVQLDGVPPEDESGVDVEGIWNRVRKGPRPGSRDAGRAFARRLCVRYHVTL